MVRKRIFLIAGLFFILYLASVQLSSLLHGPPQPPLAHAAVEPSVYTPRYFIPNETGESFLAGEDQARLLLSADGIHLNSTHAGLHIRFVGANPHARPVGAQPGTAHANYYAGNDPAQWREEVPMYTQVTYRELYPGVSLSYTLLDSQLKSEFVLQPGADLDRVRIAYEGSTSLALTPEGRLAIEAEDGSLLYEEIPLAYQVIDGRHVPVEVNFQLLDEHTYGFAVRGNLEPDAPLIVDPLLLYATFLGGSSRDGGWAIALDDAGNTFITGITHSADFPTLHPTQPQYAGNTDVFVAKLNAQGELVYATFFGGSSAEEGNAIAVDDTGNAYVGGETYSSDFPVHQAWQPIFSGDEDAYVLKLSPTGSLVYSTFLGGSESEEINDLVLDAAGRVYVGGEVYSVDFPLVNPWQSTTYGTEDEDAFLSIFDAQGELVYSTYIGANQRDQIFRLALDDAGYVYAAGMTSSPAFPVVNPLQASYGGGWEDCMFLKLDPWSNHMVYASFLGGQDRDECWGIDVDDAGRVYLGGATRSTNFPLVNAIQQEYGGGEYDAFITQVSASGQAFIFSTFVGGQESDKAWDLDVDERRNIYAVGETASLDFPLIDAIQRQFGGGTRDGFLLCLDSTGALRYGSYVGGAGDDQGWSITVNEDGQVHLAATTWSFDIATHSPIQGYGGMSDAYVARYLLFPPPTPTPSPTPTPTPFATAVVGTEGGSLWIAYPGRLTLVTIPSGTLDVSTAFTLTYDGRPDLQGELQGINQFFSIQAHRPPTLAYPIELFLGHTDTAGVISSTLDLYRLESGVWVTEGITVVERVPTHLEAQVKDMGIYGLLGRTNRLYLPVLLRRDG